MNDYNTRKLVSMFALVARMQAELVKAEGMKAENTLLISRNDYPLYREQDFIEVSHELDDIAHRFVVLNGDDKPLNKVKKNV